MSLITIDSEKCTHCGNCLEECPFRLLEMKTRDALPSPRKLEVRSAEERCINCGHCMAVCPTGALTLNCASHALPGFPTPKGVPQTQTPEDCLQIRPELNVTKDQIAHLLISRRTHRSYTDRPVPRETIEDIINVARYAPSGHNTQSENFLIVSDTSVIKQLGQSVIDFMKEHKTPVPGEAYPWDYHGTDSDCIVEEWESGKDSVFRGAPHIAMLYGVEGYADFYAHREQAAIRLAYFELAAIPYGIRTVWSGFFVAHLQMHPPVQEFVKSLVPEGYEVYDAISFGYPKNIYRRIPLRNEAEILWI